MSIFQESKHFKSIQHFFGIKSVSADILYRTGHEKRWIGASLLWTWTEDISLVHLDTFLTANGLTTLQECFQIKILSYPDSSVSLTSPLWFRRSKNEPEMLNLALNKLLIHQKGTISSDYCDGKWILTAAVNVTEEEALSSHYSSSR